jgi:hypothetical protein
MWKFSDKSCRANQNTHFVSSKFFSKTVQPASQVTDNNIKRRMRFAHWATKATGTH